MQPLCAAVASRVLTNSIVQFDRSMRPFIVAFITLGQHFVGLLLVSSILVYMKAFTAVSAVAGNVSAIGWSGILIATAIRFFVTGFWFSPKAFGDSWLAALIAEKRNPKWFHAAAKAVMPVAFASAILLPLFQTLVIAVLIQYSQVTTAVGAIKLVALLFTGFVAPYSLSDHMWYVYTAPHRTAPHRIHSSGA